MPSGSGGGGALRGPLTGKGVASPKAASDVFTAVPGGWGRRGATCVALDAAEEAALYDVLLMAWQNTAPKKLLEAHGSLGSGR